MWSILITLLRHIADPKVLGVRLFIFFGYQWQTGKAKI